MSRTDIQKNVRLSAEVVERLRFAAADAGISETSMLNRALEAALPGIPKSVVKTQIRLPGELHARLQSATAVSGRSFNSEMVKRLETTFELD